jgi:hypothetical protein
MDPILIDLFVFRVPDICQYVENNIHFIMRSTDASTRHVAASQRYEVGQPCSEANSIRVTYGGT